MVGRDIIEKGKRGEMLFTEWLDKAKLAYVSILQDEKSLATLFQGEVKRPDFIVLLDSIGVIAVDVKNCKKSNGFTQNVDKQKRTLKFDCLFRMPVWYAFFDEDDENGPWYWVNAMKVFEVGEIRHNGIDDEDFYFIEEKHFVQITRPEDLAKLFLPMDP